MIANILRSWIFFFFSEMTIHHRGEEGILSSTLIDQGGWTHNTYHQTNDINSNLPVTYTHSLAVPLRVWTQEQSR